MITIYLGDVGEYLSMLCRSVDSSATLITQDNFSNLSPGVYYTSLGDLGNLQNLASVLRQATKIVYAPPQVWSDEDNGTSKMRNWYQDYLNIFRFKCNVENFDPIVNLNQHSMLHLVDRRKSPDPQLWVSGCSISHGIGVSDQTRYGQLLSNYINQPVSFLTTGSSSIIWAADQILRSNIQKDDIVVWGLTSWTRMPYFENNSLTHVNVSNFNQHPEHPISPDTLISDNLFYQSLVSVFQVINYCSKINATLIIVSLLDDSICQYIKDYPNFMMLFKLWGRDTDNIFIDTGTDNTHPGIKTHEFYADQIYQKIQHILAKN
jgi:hypothetical protein